MHQLKDIFDRITETYETPVRIGGRCEANIFYRAEDLKAEEIEICAGCIAERIINVCSPTLPTVLVNMKGDDTGLAKILARELAPPGEVLEVIEENTLTSTGESSKQLKGANVIIVNDVITTGRSCLEAHSRLTVMGASVLCWAALIDRTFGPGPVSVVAAFTGAPVNLL